MRKILIEISELVVGFFEKDTESKHFFREHFLGISLSLPTYEWKTRKLLDNLWNVHEFSDTIIVLEGRILKLVAITYKFLLVKFARQIMNVFFIYKLTVKKLPYKVFLLVS